MTEIIKATKFELTQKAARLIKSAIIELVDKQNKVVLAVAGGRSVCPVFQLLKSLSGLPWEKVHIFMVDERLVPLDHPDSNFKIANDNFIADLVNSGRLPKNNVHPFRSEKGPGDYARELQELGGSYDVVLLSAGEDGHVGALFPNHPSIKDESEYFVLMQDSPKPPPSRMTLSRRLLLRSRVALLLFSGESKRAAFDKFNNKRIDDKSCPAKLVQSIDKSYLLTDLI